MTELLAYKACEYTKKNAVCEGDFSLFCKDLTLIIHYRKSSIKQFHYEQNLPVHLHHSRSADCAL